jgi:putative DNA primase/helicase
VAMITLDRSAEDIARALNGRREGRGWMARCPAHDDSTPSLSISQADDRVLVHCFSGCSQHAVIDELRRRDLWPGRAEPAAKNFRFEIFATPPADDAQARKRIARQLWSEAKPLGGTLGERYFIEHRKLDVRLLDFAHALRWHPSRQAIVALMTDAASGEAIGVHRTFLDGDGAKVERKMLGRQGVVCLSPHSKVTLGLGITEGVEDGLAVLLSGWAPVWVATSSGAIARFPVLAGVEALTIFADADGPGIREAEKCVDRWRSAGRDVCITAPGRPA